jgi:threonyl-tRNA synthetase
MPERFELSYQGADNAEHRPVMIHRALLGSMERFAGILTEHYGGRFPIWLAPIQAIVLPVSDPHIGYAERVADELAEAGVRVRVDGRSESVGRKVRDAELAKVPLMLVVGEREESEGTVSVRTHEGGDVGSRAVGEVPGLIA